VGWGILPDGEKTIGNMLHDASYATCWVGKWQLSGGDTRIRSAGFDKYRVFLPMGHGQREHRYKDPKLYENANYLPDSVTAGRYSEDMLYEYLRDFIHQNKKGPFFAIYATLLPAQPWVPTPDDPEFKNWDSDNDNILDDKKYFPSMVSYMDKIVGKVRRKLENEGIADNTIIMFTSATQTDSRITSMWKGQTVTGTKTTTNKAGTNIPLLVYWPNHIIGGQKSKALVDFTDFLPTLAGVANVPVPTNYGILDGTTFYDNMMGTQGKNRKWVFCHWDNNPLDDVPVERFINDKIYKLYDTVGEGNGKFYKISTDMYETHAIPDDSLTPEEVERKAYFRSILDTMHN
jgi:arylsulfatase A-like enzyme